MLIFIFLFISISTCLSSNTDENIINSDLDSIYIYEVEEKTEIEKVLHAEPLFIDLIRDLGARKGEKEWNVGMSLTDNTKYDRYEYLVEYEWAPIDRLGFEVELPFTFYSPILGNGSAPNNRLNSLKLATQWSFFVDTDISTSMALGYIHEFELNDFKNIQNKAYIGNLYNPFFIFAKRWGDNFHTLLYTGPRLSQHIDKDKIDFGYEINSNFHYMISGTRNFIGIEINQELENDLFHTVLRPQMRLGIKENLLIGIVTGIPLDKEQERFSTFIRLIWEPGH